MASEGEKLSTFFTDDVYKNVFVGVVTLVIILVLCALTKG